MKFCEYKGIRVKNGRILSKEIFWIFLRNKKRLQTGWSCYQTATNDNGFGIRIKSKNRYKAILINEVFTAIELRIEKISTLKMV